MTSMINTCSENKNFELEKTSVNSNRSKSSDAPEWRTDLSTYFLEGDYE